MDLPVRVTMPPILFTSHTGTRYAVAGSQWVEVPADTTREDLHHYLLWEPPEVPETSSGQSWQVQGSKGDAYAVRLRGDQWSCTCAGFGWRRKCKHVEAQKNAQFWKPLALDNLLTT